MRNFPVSTCFRAIALSIALPATIPGVLIAQGKPAFNPGNLVVSRSVYDNLPGNVTVGATLPPNCIPSTGGCGVAINDGTYPTVFNNDIADASFGITSRIFLDHSTPSGNVINSVEVPTDQMVTSFSSKSELALNLSTDGRYLTFMGYAAPVNALDISNSNTPLAFDATNPVPSFHYRVVASVDRWGNFNFDLTNAYSGNNGRAAVLNNSWGNDVIYTAGNAGNGGSSQPSNVILGAGAQILNYVEQPEVNQTPGLPTPVGSFSVTELGYKADKLGKDDNFRGMTVFNNVLYYTKGSGGNGVNTVYYVNTSNTPCSNGVGLPVAGATLPTAPVSTTLPLPNNMCILAGFPTTSNKAVNPVNFPFGIWFADANTLYVADEGDGTNTYDATTNTYAHAGAQTLAGLEKWIFDATSKTWKLAYTLQNGLDLGKPYTVKGYPTGNNGTGVAGDGTGLPWSPATDGLRNITGRVNDDGTVSIWAITSTVSGSGDQGADPNSLVSITDTLANTTSAGAAKEKFRTLRTAGYAEVLRGVAFGPTN